MIIQIKLFAGAQQAAGSNQVSVDVPAGATVKELRAAAAAQAPALATWLPASMFAVDGDYASDETPLSESAEVALIPPVSGG